MTNTASRMEYNMHLTFDPRCYLGRTILMQIQEVRQHVTLRKLDLSKGEHKEEKYLKINPRGLSPTLQDDPEKHTFNDSRAISLFVSNQYESQVRMNKLHSFETRFRTKQDELFWFTNDLEYYICKKYLNIWGVVLRGEKPGFSRRKKVVELLQTLMDFKDFYNSTNYFFITKYFCAAELFIAHILDALDLCLQSKPEENPLKEFPKLMEFLNKMRTWQSWRFVDRVTHDARLELGETYQKCLEDPDHRLPPVNEKFVDNKRWLAEQKVHEHEDPSYIRWRQ